MNIGLWLIVIVGGAVGIFSTLYCVISLIAVLAFKIYRRVVHKIPMYNWTWECSEGCMICHKGWSIIKISIAENTENCRSNSLPERQFFDVSCIWENNPADLFWAEHLARLLRAWCEPYKYTWRGVVEPDEACRQKCSRRLTASRNRCVESMVIKAITMTLHTVSTIADQPKESGRLQNRSISSSSATQNTAISAKI